MASFKNGVRNANAFSGFVGWWSFHKRRTDRSPHRDNNHQRDPCVANPWNTALEEAWRASLALTGFALLGHPYGMIRKQEVQQASVNWVLGRQLLFAFGLLMVAWGNTCQAAATSKASLPPEIVKFIQDKEAHARLLAKKLDLKVSPDVWAFFRTAQTGTIGAITNAFERLKKRASQYEGSRDDPTVGTPVWQTLIEVELAVEGFQERDLKYSMAFGKGVINSIPPGSIYFGGTDPGRGLVTALSKSHAKADPFFTITQNALADGRYLEYIREMYEDKIRTPTTNDSQHAFTEYLGDAQKRLDHDRRFPNEPRQIQPGEDVRIIDNRVQVSGQVAVMAINALLVKIIFDANPDREFYIEESFPLNWMYPHLSPHGLIFKLNREPMGELSEEVVKKDREFWARQQTQMIGDWLTPDTPVKDVCVFARKTFGQKEFSGFKGDLRYVEQSYANKLYSKLRSSIGGLYNWRATNSKSPEERKRMLAEADFAFRQAFALCPYSPEAIFRYVNLLLSADRLEDAFDVAATAQSFDVDNSQLEGLVSELNRMKRAKSK